MENQEEVTKKQLKQTIQGFDALPGLPLTHGKVRDYITKGDRFVMITSDRLSAFDRVLTTIPFKGELLNKMTVHWLKKTAHIADNHFIDCPHPNVIVGHACKIFPVEVIVRAYITGSAWRTYEKGHAVSGIRFPDGLVKNQKLDAAVITPTTKAEMGQHDEDIARADILKHNLLTEAQLSTIEQMALDLFAFASKEVASKNLLLVDTKFEFGIDNQGKIRVADEIFTADSSRYWIANTYEKRMKEGQEPEMLDKENIRLWLKNEGFLGDGTPPTIPDSERCALTAKYITAYEMITGESFVSESRSGDQSQIQAAVEAALDAPSHP